MSNQPKVAIRLSVLAVHGALLALATTPAMADDDLSEYTQPVSTAEIGIANVNKDSAKFGQYSGLDKSGIYGVANVEVRGGGYNTDTNAQRWSIVGRDLGLDSRSMQADYRNQGLFRLNLGYDELQSNRSDTFKTPYSGVGSNNLTLPAGWGLLRTSTTQANALPTTGLAPGNTAGGMTASNLAGFHEVDLSTKRKKGDAGILVDLSKNWSISASLKHEEKDGIQALGQTFYSTSGGQVTLPNPIHYTTDQINLALNFKGDNYYSQLSYYGSLFKDDYSSVTFSNAYQVYSGGAAPLFGRYATAPDNQFHQLNWNGGYNFTKTTKLVADLSYSRSTQNEAFIPATSYDLGTVGGAASAVGAQPNSSLNGLVVNKFVNLKLTTRPLDKLSLSTSYRYDDRDNRTPLGLYLYRWGDVVGSGTSDSKQYNVPYSKKTNSFNLVADYSLNAGQAIKGSYNWEYINRDCGSQQPLPTSALPASWPGRYASCVNVPSTKEDTFGLEYRKTMADSITGRIGISEARRRGSRYLLDVTQGSTTGAFSGYQTDIAAMQRFAYADRNREKLRGAVNWEASEKLGLGATLDLNHDKYPASIVDPSGWTYGLRKSNGWSANFDASYRISDSTVLTAYYTYDETKTHQNGNNQTSANANALITHWSADITDKTDTLGIGFKTSGLMGGKVELAGDLSYSHSRSPVSAVGDTGTCTVNATTCVGSLEQLPENFAKATALKLSGKYSLDKVSAVRIAYQYARLKSSDYAYMGLQPGAANSYSATYGAYSVLMPTMEQPPNYTVNVVAATYIYTFK